MHKFKDKGLVPVLEFSRGNLAPKVVTFKHPGETFAVATGLHQQVRWQLRRPVFRVLARDI